MSLTRAQQFGPTFTSALTSTFPYTPLGVNNLAVLLVIATTASRTLNTVTSANATWHILNSTTVALNSTTHAYAVGGIVTSAALQTVSCTFSGTPGTVTGDLTEWSSNTPGLTGWTYNNSIQNSGTSTSMLTSILTGGQVNDAFISDTIFAGTAGATLVPQVDLTYDTTNGLIYGQLATARSIPATGWAQSPSSLFYVPAFLYTPTISLPPTKIPQMVSPYQGMF